MENYLINLLKIWRAAQELPLMKRRKIRRILHFGKPHLIAKLLRPVSQRFTLEGNNAELWDETARRFEHVAPVELELLPADSMLREFYAGEV